MFRLFNTNYKLVFQTVKRKGQAARKRRVPRKIKESEELSIVCLSVGLSLFPLPLSLVINGEVERKEGRSDVTKKEIPCKIFIQNSKKENHMRI